MTTFVVKLKFSGIIWSFTCIQHRVILRRKNKSKYDTLYLLHWCHLHDAVSCDKIEKDKIDFIILWVFLRSNFAHTSKMTLVSWKIDVFIYLPFYKQYLNSIKPFLRISKYCFRPALEGNKYYKNEERINTRSNYCL